MKSRNYLINPAKFFLTFVIALGVAGVGSSSEISLSKAINYLQHVDENSSQEIIDVSIERLYIAVERRNSTAMFALGDYFVTLGDESTVARGVNLLNEAVAEGYYPAAIYLYKHHIGNGDVQSAIMPLKSLADKDNPNAILKLVSHYISGQQEEQDIAAAESYLNSIINNDKLPLSLLRRIQDARSKILSIKVFHTSSGSEINAIIAELEDLSVENSVQALNALAVLFDRGSDGVEPNKSKSLSYWSKSAQLSNPRALFELGKRYVSGDGVSLDIEKGYSLIEQSKDKGFKNAELYLARNALAGKYDKVSVEEASNALKIAYENGDLGAGVAWASSMLKREQESDGDVSQKQALGLLKELMEERFPPAVFAMSTLHFHTANDETNGLIIDALTDLTESEDIQLSVRSAMQLVNYYNTVPDFNSQYDETSRRLIRLILESGSANAQFLLSKVFLNEDGNLYNPVLGASYLEDAYKSGYGPAKIQYALTLVTGDELDTDYEQGLAILKAEADDGSVQAKKAYANLLLRPSQSFTDTTRGYEILEVLVNEGKYPQASKRLGLAYFFGRGIEQDYAKAEKYLKEASAQGEADASLILGKGYLSGIQFEKDYAKADVYLKKAVRDGELSGLIGLGDIAWRSRDNQLALQYYKRAEAEGLPQGKLKIALAYLNPRRLPGKQREGLDILEDLSKGGYVEASIQLANIYRTGRFDIGGDLTKALRYFDHAINLGDEASAGLKLTLLAEINDLENDFPKILVLYDELTDRGKAAFVRTSFSRASRHLAYILQSKLKKLDHYKLELDGLVGSGTLRAIDEYCRDDALNGACFTPSWSYQNVLRILRAQ